MPKDHENIPFFADDALSPTEPQAFAPDQMVRCEECLRANPPNRISCLYCSAALPINENRSAFLKLSLRPVENWALGYNNIFLPQPANPPATETLNRTASLLKLDPSDLGRIIAAGGPMPLARTASLEEASLINSRLHVLGLESAIVSDADLALKDSPPIHVRALSMDERGLARAKRSGEVDDLQIPWDQVILLVTGRLSRKRVELKERKASRGENEIVDVTEFFADDAAVDVYTETGNFRMLASGFDFSCLPEKTIVASRNFSLLLKVLRERASGAEYDDSYNSCRQALEVVWPSRQQTGSSGLHRERPGKFSIGAVTESSNEDQFTRYSRLRYFLKTSPTAGNGQFQ